LFSNWIVKKKKKGKKGKKVLLFPIEGKDRDGWKRGGKKKRVSALHGKEKKRNKERKRGTLKMCRKKKWGIHWPSGEKGEEGLAFGL